MFYSKEMIKNLGYKSVEEFVMCYAKKYKNCSIRYVANGVNLNYDYDSN